MIRPSDREHAGFQPVDDDDPVLKMFGRDVLAGSARTRRRHLERAFRYWRTQGFPYPCLTQHEQVREFRRLEAVSVGSVLRYRTIGASTIGLRLANAFHPQIWSVPSRRHLRAPIDHFQDDDALRKMLERAPRFWPDRRCWNAQCVRSMIRIYAGGRVANFRPAAARALIARFSERGQTVVDFSAGFGGRLLGCLTLPRTYIGIDPATEQVRGLRQMFRALEGHTSASASFIEAGAEDCMPQLASCSVDLVFSSPPYFNLEHYSSADSQSYRRYPTYSSWRDGFLVPVMMASHRALKLGGHLIINAGDAGVYTIAHDIEVVGRDLFDGGSRLRLLMHSRPLQRAARIETYRSEPIFVFRKKG